MIDHILDHKTGLNKFDRIQVGVFSDHEGSKLELNIKGILKTPRFLKII